MHTIKDELEATASHLAWAKTVAERYPDAHVTNLGGVSVFVSEACRKDADRVDVGTHGRDEIHINSHIFIVPYAEIPGGRVYAAHRPLLVVFDELRRTRPMAYRQLVDIARELF